MKFLKKHKIFTVLISLIVIFVILPILIDTYRYHIGYGISPIKSVKRDLDIILPTDSVVEEYAYEKKTGYFVAKAAISNDDIEQFKKDISNIYEKYGYYEGSILDDIKKSIYGGI